MGCGYYGGRFGLLLMLPRPYRGQYGVVEVPCCLKLSGDYTTPDGYACVVSIFILPLFILYTQGKWACAIPRSETDPRRDTQL